MGYSNMDEFKRFVIDRMRQEVDPDKDWDNLIGVRSTPPERKESGEAALDFEQYRGEPLVLGSHSIIPEPTSAKHTNATEPSILRPTFERGLQPALDNLLGMSRQRGLIGHGQIDQLVRRVH